MKPRVYIETTIPSFYYEVRSEVEMVARRKWTRRWWHDCRHDFEVVTSEAVLDELGAGIYDSKEEAMQLLADVPLLDHIHKINTHLEILTPTITTPMELLEKPDA